MKEPLRFIMFAKLKTVTQSYAEEAQSNTEEF